MFIDSDDIKKVIPEVVKIRRHIHMYPETMKIPAYRMSCV